MKVSDFGIYGIDNGDVYLLFKRIGSNNLDWSWFNLDDAVKKEVKGAKDSPKQTSTITGHPSRANAARSSLFTFFTECRVITETMHNGYNIYSRLVYMTGYKKRTHWIKLELCNHYRTLNTNSVLKISNLH